MNNQHDPVLEEELHRLRLTFAERLPKHISQTRELWNAVKREWDKSTAKLLHDVLHTIAGSSGTFGANAISKTARAIEYEIQRYINSSNGPSAKEQTAIDNIISQLSEQAERWTPSANPTVLFKAEVTHEIARDPLIYIIENDPVLSERLSIELSTAGYRTVVFNKLTEFRAHGHFEKPAAIIIDVVFPGNENGGLQIATEIRHQWTHLPPIVVVSVRDDIQARLIAVRAGVTRYFSKPLDFEKLRQTLDGLTRRTLVKPYRVLVIEDDVEVSHQYALILRAHHMDVRVENNPLLALEAISEFDPELVLLDVYMPHCTGLEIAAMVRQDDAYARMPIVFLSSETNLDRQMAAMNLGGDDFLMKPIDPDHLVSALTARLKRTRWIRRLNDDLRASLQEREFQRVALNQHGVVVTVNPQRKIVAVNARFCHLSQFNRDELIGVDFGSACFGSEQDPQITKLWEHIQTGKIWHGELIQKRKDGSFYWLDSTAVPFLDADEKPYQYVVVSTDISTIKSLMHDLSVAKSQAENANRAKSEFLSRMSHELRTPLNAIMGFSQLLEVDTDHPLSTSQLENVREIHKAGDHLLELINDVLDLARIEAGRVKLSFASIDLLQVVHDCLNFVKPLAAQQNINIIDETPKDHAILINADKTRITQITLNLLTNAVKYNTPNGSVTISLQIRPAKVVRLSVQDTGIGIATDKLEQLFQPFNRLGAEDTAVEGTGIGLVIAKNLIELMNGKLGIESQQGEGSTFWFEMPLLN